MLHTLPVEVLCQIASYLPTARDLANLGETTKFLAKFVAEDGWRELVKARFPSIDAPPQWQCAAHALTTLSRNFDRRAFIATEIKPLAPVYLPHEQRFEAEWSPPMGQTMGYQAMLDSYEIWLDSKWTGRKQVLAWSAGSQLVLGRKAPFALGDAAESDLPATSLNPSGDWLVYKEEDAKEGSDDITAINIIKPFQTSLAHQDDSELVVLGRASGGLNLVELSWKQKPRVKAFDTAQTSVRSIALSPGRSSLLAACLGDERLALYRLNGDGVCASEVSCNPAAEYGVRTWSTRFLSESTVAVGRGPSHTIVSVYSLDNGGFRNEPIRDFGSQVPNSHPKTSAYPLAPLPQSPPNTCFWSGGYDGIIRLHDMRSPEHNVLMFEDPTEVSPIFSLETVGRERLIAGCANHSEIKVFDLRMPGGRAYAYSTLESHPAGQEDSEEDEVYERGFTIFGRVARHRDSPIYSLSRPSPSSPELFAGLENRVLRLDFSSLSDKHTDSRSSIPWRASKDRSPTTGPREKAIPNLWDFSPPRTFDWHKILNLKIYEQKYASRMQILAQGASGHEQHIPGYDERLKLDDNVPTRRGRGPGRRFHRHQ